MCANPNAPQFEIDGLNGTIDNHIFRLDTRGTFYISNLWVE